MSPARGGQGPARRLAGDEGSAVVELALVAPFLVLLVLGVFEFGNAFRDRTLLTGALRSAARSASQSGTIPKADEIALSSFLATAAKMKGVTLVKVIVYKASATNGRPPATCLSAPTSGSAPYGVSGLCNVYTSGQVSVAGGGTGGSNFSSGPGPTGGCSSSDWDGDWCWDSRVITPSNADFLGVYAEYRYTGSTAIIPVGTITMTDHTIYRMEPNV